MTWKDSYFENQVLSADPLELIRMLYRGAIDSVRDARKWLKSGDIAARSAAITRAQAIVAELNASLDRANGGEISSKLEALYAYICRRLTEANFRQMDAPLAEAENLLNTLYAAWQETVPAEPEREPPIHFHALAEMAVAESHAWSA